MQAISKQDWQAIPQQAQQEVYDFYLFIKQRYAKDDIQKNTEIFAFSNHTANLIEDWKNEEEDSVWK